LPRLQYYGCVQSDSERCWLFVEDAGVERYSPHIEEHRRLAAQWLGTMHTIAARVAVASGLPDRGLSHYVMRLRAASALVRRLLADIPLEGDDRIVLESIVAQCDQLTARWNAVKRICNSVPRTMVHGDFRGKNMRVRTHHSGTVLLPFDWETAGWGLPTIDLAWLVDDGAAVSSGRAMDIYRSTISQLWPELAVHDIGVLAHLGTVFRLLDAVNWACDGLSHERVDEATEKSLGQLRFYQELMITAMGNLNL
jgi:aminoglycoside phosphotransferase (APT) family kinase protein